MSTNLINPLRHLRLAAGLTQGQLANLVKSQVLIGDYVTEQYIRRAEKGLVGTDTDLSNILSVLHAVINARHSTEDRVSYTNVIRVLSTSMVAVASELDYPHVINSDVNSVDAEGLVADWYSLKRALIHKKLGEDKCNCLARNYNSFKEFRLALSHALNIEPTMYSFCVMLGLHPYVVTRFEQMHPVGGEMPPGISNYWSEDLRVALSQAGINWKEISFGNQTAFSRGVAHQKQETLL